MEPDEINDDDKMTEIMKIDTGNMNFPELLSCSPTDTHKRMRNITYRTLLLEANVAKSIHKQVTDST